MVGLEKYQPGNQPQAQSVGQSGKNLGAVKTESPLDGSRSTGDPHG